MSTRRALGTSAGADVRHASDCSTVLRRFAGPEAHELAMLCRPDGAAPDPGREAEATYRALAALLAAEHTSFEDLACETLFLRDVQRDLPVILDVRARVLADLGQHARAPVPSFIQQAPLAGQTSFELSAAAVVPHRRNDWAVRDVSAAPSCPCEGCARSGARLVRLGDQASLHTANVYGGGSDAFEQAFDMFCAAERLLERCGMAFRDVVRTWIHLRDIERDYDAFNRARRKFFESLSIAPLPASTGVQGIPFPGAHDFSLRLNAVTFSRPLDVRSVSTPSLNEAWSYGANFSRGLRVTDTNKVTLYVSGTASIDEAGRTAHAGDLPAQVDRMLHNIASLLAEQGAGFGDLVSGVAYLKHPSDAPVVRSMFRHGGFEGFPCAMVHAPLCRPELLCEAEAVAILPLTPAGA